jgi:hypothetical protein
MIPGQCEIIPLNPIIGTVRRALEVAFAGVIVDFLCNYDLEVFCIACSCNGRQPVGATIKWSKRNAGITSDSTSRNVPPTRVGANDDEIKGNTDNLYLLQLTKPLGIFCRDKTRRTTSDVG